MNLFKDEKILTKLPIKHKHAISFAIAFPNTYKVGMSSLGYQNAWKLFSQSEDIKVFRWFTDIEERMHKLPNYIGFSLSWELDYKNIFSILEKHNIPLYAKDRGEKDPIVFCGGQVLNANPEPFSEFFDFFLLGDLEVIADELIHKIVEIRNLKREEKLNELSKLPGVYVSSRDAINHISTIKRQSTTGNLAYSSILTPNTVWPNTFLVEVVRSCPELCRFCLASYGSLPFRTPSVKESLIPIVDIGLQHTNKIGLMGPSITQHPEFETLIEHLLHRCRGKVTLPLQVQIASVRADTISKNLADGLYKLGAKSITMAVETGSERLRDLINKKVNNETIINSIQTIHEAGFKSIKLYGIAGLPFETQDDLEETVKFLKNLKSVIPNLKLIWGCSVFVPKAGTPFQFFGVDKGANKKLKYLSKELHQLGVDFRPESYKWAEIQALISRGDRNISNALVKAYRYGSSLGAFNKALKEEKINKEYFIHKNWQQNERLPWQNIQGHLNKEVIENHTKKILELVSSHV